MGKEFLQFLNKAGGVETIGGSVVNLNGEGHRGSSLGFSVPAQGDDWQKVLPAVAHVEAESRE